MNWNTAKGAIGKIAPWLAGTLGTPIAGIAVQGICDVLGLTSDSRTPENLIAALSGATPGQLEALRNADIVHAEFMAKLGYESLAELEHYTIEDRDSARRREAAVRDSTPRILAALAVIVFLCVIGFVASGQAVADSMRDGFWLLVGAVIATYKDVYGYYFGSSHGSHTKDDTIKAISSREADK